MTHRIRLFVALGALGLAPLASAAAPAWDYLDVRYAQVQSLGFEGSGFGFGVVKAVNESGHLVFEYDDLAFDIFGFDVGITTLRAGFGGHMELNDTTAALFEVTYESIEAAAMGSSVEQHGFGVRIGARAMIAPDLEFNVGLRHVAFDGASDKLFGAGAVYLVNDRFGVTVSIENGVDRLFRFGARLAF